MSTMTQYPDIVGTEGIGAVVHVVLCLLLPQANDFHTLSTALPMASIHREGDCLLRIDTGHHATLALLKPW